MNSYLFIGRILPERVKVSIPKIIFNDLILPDSPNFKIGNLTVESKDSILEVNLTTTQTFHLPTIKNSIEFYIRVIVDSFGYCTGQAFDVDLEIVSGPGQSATFSPRINSLYKQQGDRPLPPEEVLKLAVKNVSLFRALGNLREAIKHPIDVGMYCYRAIENIRQHFVKTGISTTQSWALLHRALNISRQFINTKPSLTIFSEQSRHGETHNISGSDIEKVLHKTWLIMDRFCIYLKNNECALDPGLYPKV